MMRRQGMVLKTSGTTALTHTVPDGKSYMLRDILFHAAAAGAEDHKLTVDQKDIYHFVAPSGWYMASGNPSGGYTPIWAVLRNAGIRLDVPVEAGQKIQFTAPGASDYLGIVYDEYDKGDILRTMPNGTEASRRTLLQQISNSGTRATAGDLDLDQSDLASSFPAFPGGAVVPARHTMSLVALFGTATSKGTGAANGEYTTYLKALRNQQLVSDPDLTGWYFLGDSGHTAASVDYDTIVARIDAGVQHNLPRIVLFDPPIVFEAGEELNMIATIGRTGAGADFAAGDIKLGMVFDVQRI